MKKGIDYLSPEQRNELARQIKNKRHERDEAQKEAIVSPKSKLDKIIQIFSRRESKSNILHKKAEQLNADARRILETAKTRNTHKDWFKIGSEIELSNLLQDKDRFSEFETAEVMRVYKNIKKHYNEIEKMRLANPTIEPGGYILDDRMQWSDNKTWGEEKFDIELSCQERMELADKGAIFIHCHPTRSGLDDFQTSLSGGDYLATVIDRNEVVFCQAGVVLGTSTKRYSYEETEKIIDQFSHEAVSGIDYGWEMVSLAKDKFGIKSFTLHPSNFTSESGKEI
ncbi:MAG: hypothetical protein V1838_03145 [Patescibacteria group bacterium]